LVDAVRAHVEQFIVARFGVAGEHVFVLCGLVCDDFFRCEFGVFAVGDAPEAVGGDFCGHVVVFVVDDEVDVVVAELIQGVIHLEKALARRKWREEEGDKGDIRL